MKRLLLAILVTTGCGTDSVPPPDPAAAEPVYYGQVQRIVNDNCVECHSTDPDRLAPFSLATYEDTAAAAADLPMAYAVMNRIMPPFYADQDGECHTFPNAHWLSDEDLTTFTAWINGARLAGDPANSVAPPPPPGGLAEIDHTVDTGVPYSPDPTIPDDFKCFVVDAIGANKFVTGAHVRPSNLTVAHHVILFTLDSPAAEADALARQAAAGGGPYRCDGGPTELGATFLVGWVPGNQATAFPPNTGIAVDGTRKLVVQMHYNLANSDGKPDHTTIDLDLADTVAKPAQMIKLSGNVDLPPRDPDAIATGVQTIPGSVSRVKLWGGGVHMHQRGTAAKLTVESSGANDQCLMDLVNWSFHWQHFYWYAEPVELRGGDTVRLTCHYDTSLDDTNVKFCEGTECEMCIQFVYVTQA